MSASPPPAYLKAEGTCKYTGLTRRMLDTKTRSGEIPCHRVSERVVLYAVRELDEWLASHGPDGAKVSTGRGDRGRFTEAR